MNKEKTLELMLDFGIDGKTLLPVVTQDYVSKDVLLVSFVNEEAFKKTLRTGYATYWSRSRNQLWTKGETSGDKLKIKEIRINCEQNALLYLVEMEGQIACHTKNKSCFYRKVNYGRLILVD